MTFITSSVSSSAPTAPSPRAPFVRPAIVSALLAGALALGGCGAVDPLAPSAAATSGASLAGHVHGGQQPVGGSLIQLWAAGTSGNGSAATPLLTTAVYTDGNGSFGISGDYTCPSATSQVYLTATGGNPGLGGSVNNQALTLVTMLGNCGTLPTVPSIAVNELTTVAAAYALAPFATSIANVGASSTNLTGLQNAMRTGMMLADSYSGGAPAASLPSNAHTETAKLLSLANILASCVNSNGGALCSGVFADATPTSGVVPADSFQLALTIAQNPGNNVTTLFNDAPAHAAFGGSLSLVPNDFTMSISYTGGGLSTPDAMTIEASGSVWIANSAGPVSGFSPQGVPVNSTGITATGISSVSIAMDSSQQVWVANSGVLATQLLGSVARLSSPSVTATSTVYSGSGISAPVSLAAAPDTSIWVANNGGRLTRQSSNGAIMSGLFGYGAALLGTPSAIAVDASSTPWITDKLNGDVVHLSTTGVTLTKTYITGTPNAIALDSAGGIWAGDSAAGTLSYIKSDGTLVNTISNNATLAGTRALAIDGGGHVFILAGNGIAEVMDSSSGSFPGTFVRPLAVGVDAALAAPQSIAADSSGNLWVTSSADNRLVTFVGLAAPVKTPLIGLPTKP